MEPVTAEMKKNIQLEISRELKQLTQKVAGLEEQVSRQAKENGKIIYMKGYPWRTFVDSFSQVGCPSSSPTVIFWPSATVIVEIWLTLWFVQDNCKNGVIWWDIIYNRFRIIWINHEQDWVTWSSCNIAFIYNLATFELISHLLCHDKKLMCEHVV